MPKVTDETDASIVADVIVGGLGGKPQIFQVPLKGLKFISFNINLIRFFSFSNSPIRRRPLRPPAEGECTAPLPRHNCHDKKDYSILFFKSDIVPRKSRLLVAQFRDDIFRHHGAVIRDVVVIAAGRQDPAQTVGGEERLETLFRIFPLNLNFKKYSTDRSIMKKTKFGAP